MDDGIEHWVVDAQFIDGVSAKAKTAAAHLMHLGVAMQKLTASAETASAAGVAAGVATTAHGKAVAAQIPAFQRFTDQVGLLHRGLGPFESAFTRTGSAVWRFSTGAGRAFIGWSVTALRYMGLLGAAAAAFGGKFAVGLEQAQVAFAGKYGESGSNDFLTRLQRQAVFSPLNFEQLVAASRGLAGAGLDAKTVLRSDQLISDIASSSGNLAGATEVGKQFAQVAALRKLGARNIRSLVVSGGVDVIPALAKQAGMDRDAFVRLMSSTGGNALAFQAVGGYEGFLKALESVPGVAGASLKQAKTWKGLSNNIIDAFQIGLGNATLPILNLSKGWFISIVDKLFPAEGQGVLARFGDRFALGFQALLSGNRGGAALNFSHAFGLGDGAAPLFDNLLRSMGAVRRMLGAVAAGFGDVFSRLFAGSTAGRGPVKSFADALDQMASHAPEIRVFVRDTLSTFIDKLADIGRAAWPVVRQILPLLPGLLLGFASALEKVLKVAAFLAPLMKPLLAPILIIGGGAFAIGKFLTFVKAMGDLAKFMGLIKGVGTLGNIGAAAGAGVAAGGAGSVGGAVARRGPGLGWSLGFAAAWTIVQETKKPFTGPTIKEIENTVRDDTNARNVQADLLNQRVRVYKGGKREGGPYGPILGDLGDAVRSTTYGNLIKSDIGDAKQAFGDTFGRLRSIVGPKDALGLGTGLDGIKISIGHVSVDARGATDPAAVTAAAKRAFDGLTVGAKGVIDTYVRDRKERG